MVAQESRREKTKPKGTAASWEPPDPSHRRPHSPGGERIISEQSLLLKVGPSNLGIETDDRNSSQREQLPPPNIRRGWLALTSNHPVMEHPVCSSSALGCSCTREHADHELTFQCWASGKR